MHNKPHTKLYTHIRAIKITHTEKNSENKKNAPHTILSIHPSTFHATSFHWFRNRSIINFYFLRILTTYNRTKSKNTFTKAPTTFSSIHSKFNDFVRYLFLFFVLVYCFYIFVFYCCWKQTSTMNWKKNREKNWWISHFLFRRLLLRERKECGSHQSILPFNFDTLMSVCGCKLHMYHFLFYLLVSMLLYEMAHFFNFIVHRFSGLWLYAPFLFKIKNDLFGFFSLHSFLSSHVSSFFVLFISFKIQFLFYLLL